LVLILAPALIIMEMYIFSPGFLIAKKTVWQMWMSAFTAAVAGLASFSFVGLWGLYGAAWSALISAIAFFWSWFALSQRLYRIPVRWGAIALICGGGAGAGAIGMWAPFDDPVENLVLKAAVIAATAGLIAATGVLPIAEAVRAAKNLVGRRGGRPTEQASPPN
jgi:hypothetical protein